MPKDALEPTRSSRDRSAIRLACIVAIALGLPWLLHLDLRAGAAVAVAVLGAATLAASAMRAALADRGGATHCEHALLALAATLPQGVLLLRDGRLHDANDAARTRLGIEADDAIGTGASEIFGDAADAVLGTADFDGEVALRRHDGVLLHAQVSARDVPVDGPRLRLVLFIDVGSDTPLTARLDRQRVELETLARRLMTVQEDERASISRELHDDIGQAITAIKLCASSLVHEPEPIRWGVVHDTAQEIATIADQTVAKLRDLSLLLRPPQLDALGLEAALRWQASTLFRSEYPKLELDVPPLDCRPPRDVELACFRIAQEALTNALRHARAGRVRVELHCDDTELRLRVEDDGQGVAPDHHAGLGLITMRERARQVGGRLSIESRPGRTSIEAVLPLPPESGARTGVPEG